MKVVLFGATGMLGSGALIECLEHPDVDRVLSVVRRPAGVQHAKLSELVHDDFLDFSRVAGRLSGYDGCLFCLGVSSAGMSEEAYRRVTRDMPLAAARTLMEVSPELTFCFISGAGTDSSEAGRVMWARVKGETENRLLGLPFRGVWLFRPGYVQPMKGVRSRTRLYNAAYALLGPLYPLLRRLGPGVVTTTESLGLALIRVAREGASKRVLENRDINELAEAERARIEQRD
jgi:uncharacterized protein YbjT (DUF2867 family)